MQNFAVLKQNYSRMVLRGHSTIAKYYFLEQADKKRNSKNISKFGFKIWRLCFKIKVGNLIF